MNRTKKLLTSAVALGLAGVMAIGGTFAWQSISQEVLNESGDQVNPGGRLHNDLYYTDLNTTDSNVYVENFMDPEGKGSQDIFARVRLEEYMEVVLNYGTAGQQTQSVIGTREDTTETDDQGNEKIVSTKYNYKLFDFKDHVKEEDGVYTVTAGLVENGDTTDSNFTWTMGGEKTEAYYYMPTFNKNKDSLEADLNGMYVKRVGGIDKRDPEQYSGEAWTETSSKEGYEIYDADSNLIDELKDLDITDLNKIIDEGNLDDAYKNSVKLSKKLTHEAKTVGKSKGFISMEKWMELKDTEGYTDENGDLTKDGRDNLYGYWVYDEDGWVYWSAPIGAGETTGLLLDDFTLSQVMNHTWYYAINVVGQFCTADDVGKEDGTGFYATLDTPAAIAEDGEDETEPAKPVSENAEELLQLIGVRFDERETVTVKLWNGDELNGNMGRAFQSVKSTDNWKLEFSEDGSVPEKLTGVYFNGDKEDAAKYTYKNGVLTLTDKKDMADGALVYVSANNAAGHPRLTYMVVNDDGKLSLRNAGDLYDVTFAEVGKGVKVLKDGKAATEEDLTDLTFFWRNFDEDDKETPVEGTDYKFENGELTLLNPAYKNGHFGMQKKGADGKVWQGYLVVAEDDDDDDSPKVYRLEISRYGDGQGHRVVSMASIKTGDLVELYCIDNEGGFPKGDDLWIRAMRPGELKLTDGVEYTYDEETGLLDLELAADYPDGGCVMISFGEFGDATGIILMNDDGVVDLRNGCIDVSAFKLGEAIKVTVDGEALTEEALGKIEWMYAHIKDDGTLDLGSNDYTFEDGTLTISDSKFADTVVQMIYTADDNTQWTGAFYLLDEMTMVPGTPIEDDGDLTIINSGFDWHFENGYEEKFQLTAACEGASESELAAVQWSMEGASSSYTKLSAATGKETELSTLLESTDITVTATATIGGQTRTASTVIENGPKYGTIAAFKSDDNSMMAGAGTYTTGENKYYVNIYGTYASNLQTETPYSGAELEKISKKLTVSLKNEVEGVTLTQKGNEFTITALENVMGDVEVDIQLSGGADLPTKLTYAGEKPAVAFTLDGSTDSVKPKVGEKNAYTLTLEDYKERKIDLGLQLNGQTQNLDDWDLTFASTNGDFTVDDQSLNLGGSSKIMRVYFNSTSDGRIGEYGNTGTGLVIYESVETALTITASKDGQTAKLYLEVTRPEVTEILIVDDSEQKAEEISFDPNFFLNLKVQFKYEDGSVLSSDAAVTYRGNEKLTDFYFVESADPKATKIEGLPTGVNNLNRAGNVADTILLSFSPDLTDTLYLCYGLVGKPDSYSVVTLTPTT